MLFEQLEGRRLMSVSLNAATGVLTAGGPSVVSVYAQVKNGQFVVTEDGQSTAFAAPKVKRVVVRPGASFVELAPSVTVPSEIRTGPGLVSVVGGSGPDTIYLEGRSSYAYGGAGNDTFYISSGDVVADGQAGNDTFKFLTGPDDQRVAGGAGYDTADFSAYRSGILIQNGPTGTYVPNSGLPPRIADQDRADALSGMESFIGTQGDDYIYGNDAANYLDGQGGNDYIRGGGGDDALTGGAGEDALYGDAGNDQFFTKGDGKVDFLSGGAGTDKARRDAADILNSIEGSL